MKAKHSRWTDGIGRMDAVKDTNLKAKHSTMQNDIAGIGDAFDTNLKANHNDNTRSA